MQQNAVVIEHIVKRFGTVRALDDISLTVARGELFGLIGADGAGKTTLLRILTTLLLADAGSASVNGLDVVRDYRKLRTLIGYMPGRFSLYQDLTVEENLHFFASVFGTTVEENYDLVKDIYVQLEPFGKRKAGKLSGGMKQKLALCCALIHEPEVLFLDEPTTGVDAVSRVEFWEMLDRLREKGISIMVSTPYMDEAERCDRIAMIQKGSLLAVETPANITSLVPMELFAITVREMHRLSPLLKDYPYTASAYAFGDSLHYTDTRKGVQCRDIEDFLDSKGFSGISVKPLEPGIEDTFIALMQQEGDHER